MKRVLIILTVFSLLISCNPDCKDISLEKPVWESYSEDYWIDVDTVEYVRSTVDSLVSYSIEEHSTRKKYKTDSKGEYVGSTMTHYITIKNNNRSFSNAFAVRLTGKEYNDITETWKNIDYTTKYVSIKPNSSYTFSVSHSDWWRNESNDYYESNVSITILQESNEVYRITPKVRKVRKKIARRFDKLLLKDTVVNNCRCDVDALKAKYETIRDVFERLESSGVIKVK